MGKYGGGGVGDDLGLEVGEPSEHRDGKVGAFPGQGFLDGDGFLDMVVGDSGLNEVQWFRSRGCGRSPPFRRGDVDGDGRTLISDAVVTLHALFAGAGPLGCADAADTDDDGKVVLTDAVALLLYLFQGGATPALPFSTCGQDPTEDRLGDCEGRGEGGCGG